MPRYVFFASGDESVDTAQLRKQHESIATQIGYLNKRAVIVEVKDSGVVVDIPDEIPDTTKDLADMIGCSVEKDATYSAQHS